MELRRMVTAERASRKTEDEWAQALLEEERAARHNEVEWLNTAKLYCTRSTGGARFHTNKLCGGLREKRDSTRTDLLFDVLKGSCQGTGAWSMSLWFLQCQPKDRLNERRCSLVTT
jgi:hypothetical protein